MGQTSQNFGNPIVNLSFGSGTNPGNAISEIGSGYDYVASDCPWDGTYAVRNHTDSCSDNTWHSLAQDHTGEPDGYFLMVNAASEPGVFFQKEVNGLCGGTTYQLSGWFMNILKPYNYCSSIINPDISFIISNENGDLIDSLRFSIPISDSPVWKQYSLVFTTAPGVMSVNIIFKNNASGGCGNDFVLDDVQLRPCLPVISSGIIGMEEDAVSVCRNQFAGYHLKVQAHAGFHNPEFQWQVSDNGTDWNNIPFQTDSILMLISAPGSDAGVWKYRPLVAEAGNTQWAHCKVTGPELTVRILPQPVISISSNQPVCDGKPLMVTATATSPLKWTFPDGNVLNSPELIFPSSGISNAGMYYVTAVNDDGCSTTDSIRVQVFKSVKAEISPAVAKVCEGMSVEVKVSGSREILWLPQTGVSAIGEEIFRVKPSATTSYTVVVTGDDGFCKDTVGVHIDVIPTPKADAGPDRNKFGLNPVQLLGQTNHASFQIHWSPETGLSDPGILHPWASPSGSQYYVLEVSSPDGCGTAKDSAWVSLIEGLLIPSAFTPNGDGINDSWRIPGLAAYPDYRITIYDRWSNPVYDVSDIGKGWDGTQRGMPLPVGTYSYILKIKGKAPQKGTVTLIR